MASLLPLPQTCAEQLRATPNPSLWFDRGVDTYDSEWVLGTGKQAFFREFITRFKASHAKAQFAETVKRRRATLATTGTAMVAASSVSRLVVGLGLPHPTETGFLLDRLTGCPYLPGSGVKGLLRAAASLADAGEFPETVVPAPAVKFWHDNRGRMFGPARDESACPAKGAMVFYDAFPALWPQLNVDVMTPHFGQYYSHRAGKIPPADWDDPNPVPFVAVAARTTFEFFFRGLDVQTKEEDEAAVRALLPVALDWLGAGAKRSSGYGAFTGGEKPRPGAGAPSTGNEPALTRVAPSAHGREQGGRGDHGQSHEYAGPRRKPDHEIPFAAPPREAVRDAVTKEIVTLESLVKDNKAWVTTTDNARLRCKGVVAYPRHPRVGDRFKANVTRRAGVPIEAEFKGWIPEE
jgi:CRISPR-associated protein Cmr6